MLIKYLNTGGLNNNLIFWILNSAGWIGISLIIYGFSKNTFSSLSFAAHISFFSYYFFCLVITSMLRPFLRKIIKRKLSVIEYLGTITLISLITFLIIFNLHFVASLPYFANDFYINYDKFGITFPIYYRHLIAFHPLLVFILLFLWTGLYFGLNLLNALTNERDRSEKATLQAQKAQLEMLRYQLNPHFLFNSLNSIWALVDEDTKATKSMIIKLSEYLRYSLLYNNQPLTQLLHEIDALKNYFSIEEKRFQDKLQVVFDIDPAVYKYPILSFMLQPFVENAVKFGMQTSPMPLKIDISARFENNDLVIIIKNSGYWIEHENYEIVEMKMPGTGMGIKNVSERMALIYPNRHSILYINDENSVSVKIIINPES